MSFAVTVDPTNPGQFFACCGMLELADRLWQGGAEGRFAPTATEFHLRPITTTDDATSDRLLGEIAACPVRNTMTDKQVNRREELGNMTAAARAKVPGLDDEKKALDGLWRESPIVLGGPFGLRIDWFLDDWAGGSRFKTWAGMQSVIDIACTMKAPIGRGDWNGVPPADWLGQPTDDEGLSFNFDSDLAVAGSAIDMGFSLDPLGMSVPTRPFLELLAFVGLQRFRPADRGENRYDLTFWTDALPPELAAPAAAGVLDRLDWPVYRFRLLYRTKYLKSFLPAQRTRGV